MPLLLCRNDAIRRPSEMPRPCPARAEQSLLVQDNPMLTPRVWSKNSADPRSPAFQRRMTGPAPQSQPKGPRKNNLAICWSRFWLLQGARKEHSPSSVTDEQHRQKQKSAQPKGAGRHRVTCGVAPRLQPTEGMRPRRAWHLTRWRSRQMPQVIFAPTLSCGPQEDSPYSAGARTSLWNGR